MSESLLSEIANWFNTHPIYGQLFQRCKLSVNNDTHTLSIDASDGDRLAVIQASSAIVAFAYSINCSSIELTINNQLLHRFTAKTFFWAALVQSDTALLGEQDCRHP
jgi:hypothetical protein